MDYCPWQLLVSLRNCLPSRIVGWYVQFKDRAMMTTTMMMTPTMMMTVGQYDGTQFTKEDGQRSSLIVHLPKMLDGDLCCKVSWDVRFRLVKVQMLGGLQSILGCRLTLFGPAKAIYFDWPQTFIKWMNEWCRMDIWQLLCRVKDKFPLQPEWIISLYIHFYVMTWSHSRVLEPTRMVGPTLISRISDSDPIGKHFKWPTKYRFVSLGFISRTDKRMAPWPRQPAKDVDVIKIFHQHPGLPHIQQLGQHFI